MSTLDADTVRACADWLRKNNWGEALPQKLTAALLKPEPSVGEVVAEYVAAGNPSIGLIDSLRASCFGATATFLRDLSAAHAREQAKPAVDKDANAERDKDWILAMASAFGTGSGLSIPIVPDVEGFRALAGQIQERATLASERASGARIDQLEREREELEAEARQAGIEMRARIDTITKENNVNRSALVRLCEILAPPGSAAYAGRGSWADRAADEAERIKRSPAPVAVPAALREAWERLAAGARIPGIMSLGEQIAALRNSGWGNFAEFVERIRTLVESPPAEYGGEVGELVRACEEMLDWREWRDVDILLERGWSSHAESLDGLLRSMRSSLARIKGQADG